MIRAALVALLVGAVAAGGVLLDASRRASAERAAADEVAEALADRHATAVEARFLELAAIASETAAFLCEHPDVSAESDPGRLVVEPTLGVGFVWRGIPAGSPPPHTHDALVDVSLAGGPPLVAWEASCAPQRARAGWTLPRLEALLGGVGAVAIVPVDEDPPALTASESVLRRGRSIGAGPEERRLVTWVTRPATTEGLDGSWLRALGVGALVLLLALLGMSGRGGRDRALEAAVARIGKGDLDVTLDGRGGTASAFNRMTRELRDARTRLARAERIAAWRDIARRIAHEIKNPLTPIKMAMETARKTHARRHPDFDEIFDESTRTVLEEVTRLERIVTEFSRFARLPRPNPESLNVREVVERVVAMHDLDPAHATLPEAAKGVRVELALGQSKFPEVRADREQLTQVLVNLVQNACDAAREKHGETGGRVLVELAATPEAGVRITISDNGPGIPEEERARVLEPYYTTKSHGTGLGLAIVERIVSDHGGSLTIAESPLGGAAIVIALRREGPPEEPDVSVAG